MQRFYIDHPQFRNRDVVLYERYRGSCFRVVSCTGKSAIRPGMTLTEAQALANVHAAMHDPIADHQALLELANWCERFSPIVGIEGTDNLCLDITGLAHLFGSEEQILQRAKRAFVKCRLHARMAVANTIGAAWAMSHCGSQSIVSSMEALAELPIASLRLSFELVATLSQLGVDTVGQLTQLPRTTLLERFGPELLLRIDQASGEACELIKSHRPLPDIAAEMPLEYGITNRLSLETILGKLIEQVCKALSDRQQGAIQLDFELHTERNDVLRILVGLYRASVQARHLMDLTQTQFERLTLPAPVNFVKLSVLHAAPLQTYQQDLFADSQAENQRQLSLLIDRLSSRLGRNDVVRAVMQNDAQPEMAVRYEPLTGSVRNKMRSTAFKRLARPIRLERKPIPIKVVLDSTHRKILAFHWQGIHSITGVWGPERIQTAWWRGRYIQRDYFRVEAKSGERFWLFRRIQDGEWFLHGVFD